MRNSLQGPELLGRSAASAIMDGKMIGKSIATAAALIAMLATINPYPAATMKTGATTMAPISRAMICDAVSIPRTYIQNTESAKWPA